MRWVEINNPKNNYPILIDLDEVVCVTLEHRDGEQGGQKVQNWLDIRFRAAPTLSVGFLLNDQRWELLLALKRELGLKVEGDAE